MMASPIVLIFRYLSQDVPKMSVRMSRTGSADAILSAQIPSNGGGFARSGTAWDDFQHFECVECISVAVGAGESGLVEASRGRIERSEIPSGSRRSRRS